MTLVTAKCKRCGDVATGKTFAEASTNINHAIGRSIGVPCGPSFNGVFEVKTEIPKTESTKTPKKITPKKDTRKKSKDVKIPLI